jgi:hypothetical protein
MRLKISEKSWLLVVIIIYACNHGIGPTDTPDKPQNPGGISGQIYYQNWPPAEEVKNLKVIVFLEYPPDDILNEVQSGRAIVHPPELSVSLPQFVDSSYYVVQLEPGIYEYVVVAQQYGGLLDWRAVGHYSTIQSDSIPSPVLVISDSILQDIDIYVDFDNLPIQPF